MPADPAALAALAARLEAATEGSRELDGALTTALLGYPVLRGEMRVGDGMDVEIPWWTDSLDAAVALCEATLPGAHWSVEGQDSYGIARSVVLLADGGDASVEAPTPELALCKAVVAACTPPSP